MANSEAAAVPSSNTKVLPCDCTSATELTVKSAATKFEMAPKGEIPWQNRTNGAEYQDKKYGKGNRLHNIRRKGSVIGATCTVCGRRKVL